ncbi:MAG: chloramphenicol acetyltransferase CAT [Oscillospiraceae bacterium]|nr:chloramphenicol acetyltransferase CAT [Oscillospiraceae bacterium]
MAFHLIDMETWERQEHYQYYQTQVHTGYTLTVNMKITTLLNELKRRKLRFYPTFLYITATAVNQHREMRMDRNENQALGYWDQCNPSYTIFHSDDHTFSDIWTLYSADFSTFYRNCVQDMECWQEVKGIKTKPGRPDNFTPISCLPWLSYGSMSYDTPMTAPMLFPVILFGRYESKDGEVLLPFSVHVQHSVADGYHTAMFLQTVQRLADTYANWMV